MRVNTKPVINLSPRDRLIIAHALCLCPIAELGDRVGGRDAKTAEKLAALAAIFDYEVAQEYKQDSLYHDTVIKL